jgi:hypothetical protein
MNLYLDIETLPTTDPEVIAELSAGIKPPGTIKKQESIDAWMAENFQSALDDAVAKTSFAGLYGSIACICYALDDGEVHSVSVNGQTEEEMLIEFYSHVIELTSIESHCGMISSPITFVGHNLVGFDLPFLKHRSIINRVRPPVSVIKAFDAKPWGNEVADTMLMWSSDPHKRGSMDRLCKAFGIPGKGDFDGSMVASTWPTDPKKVIDYCADDVRRTREMYKRLTFQFDQKQLLKAA